MERTDETWSFGPQMARVRLSGRREVRFQQFSEPIHARVLVGAGTGVTCRLEGLARGPTLGEYEEEQ